MADFSKWWDQPGNDLPDYSPDWLKKTGTLTLPQAGPGQLEMLSRQLAMGGFGNAGDNYKWLDNAYDPVVAPDFYKPDPKTVTDDPKKPVTTTGTPVPLSYYTTGTDSQGRPVQKPWWQTSLATDPRYIKQFGDSRVPPGSR